MARVVVDVMLKPEILDPAGQAVAGALPRLGVTDVTSVRIGKRIEIDFAGAVDLDRTRQIANELLANPVIEDFTIRAAGETADPGRPEVPLDADRPKAPFGEAGPGRPEAPVDAVAAADPVEPDVPAPAPEVARLEPLPEGTPLVPAAPVDVPEGDR